MNVLGIEGGDKSGVHANVDFEEDAVSLLPERMDLLSGVRQVSVARSRTLDQQVGRLTNEFHLLLKVLEELLVAWKKLRGWTIIFSYRWHVHYRTRLLAIPDFLSGGW